MVSQSDLFAMNPYDFEEFIAKVWEAKGFDTNVTEGSRDRGIDIVAEKTGWKELIQAKRYGEGNTVGSQKVREYATLYQQEPTANKVVIVTSSSFTEAAQTLADDLRVDTIAGNDLIGEVNHYNVTLDESETTETKETTIPEENQTYVSKVFERQCEYCNREFSSISRYRDHLLDMHKSELHNCTICAKVFIEESSLDRHITEHHRGANVEQSQDEKSPEGRSTDDVAKKSQIECEFCELSFGNDSEFWNHLIDAHDNELYFCHNCKIHYQNEQALGEHLYQDHNQSNLGRIDQHRRDRYLESKDDIDANE